MAIVVVSLITGYNVAGLLDNLLQPGQTKSELVDQLIADTNSRSKKSAMSTLFKSPKEAEITARVAKDYKLDEEGTKLLFAIREVENGRQGREFGVLRPEAMRFENDPDPMKSFEIQAMWAAGTIRDRFTGDLKAFADRWAPIGAKNDPKNLNKNWLPNILDKMNKGE